MLYKLGMDTDKNELILYARSTDQSYGAINNTLLVCMYCWDLKGIYTFILIESKHLTSSCSLYVYIEVCI